MVIAFFRFYILGYCKLFSGDCSILKGSVEEEENFKVCNICPWGGRAISLGKSTSACGIWHMGENLHSEKFG